MVSFFARSLILLGLTAAALSAQVTHRIPADQLQATIRRATAGDIILVRGGFVGVTTLTIDKPLYIHGSQAAMLGTTFVNISAIPQGAELVLSGFTFVPEVFATGCRGRLLLFNLKHGLYSFSDCADVTMAGCETGWVDVQDGRLEISDSRITGTRFNARFPMLPGTHGVRAAHSTVTVWNSTILGGWKDVDLPPVHLDRSSLWLHRTTLENRLVNGAASAVTGSGTMVYDPSVVMRLAPGARPIGAGVSATRRALPLFTMPPVAIGSPAVATLHGAAGSPYGIFVGWPGQAVAVPGILGVLEVSQPVLVQLGRMPAAGLATLPFTVPNDPNLRGQMFRWQGITVHGPVAEWSNAVTECHY